jgi:hypothetical protein
MEREVFAARFREAAVAARDFARQFIEEDLPNRMLFRTRLNSSYDGNPLHQNERVYPEDSHLDRAEALRERDEDVVVSALWRNGLVPEWINVQVCGRREDATLIEVLSCGRFTADARLLYHKPEGRPPLHVLGPALPVDYQAGQRFSIYHRAECWSQPELEDLLPHRDRVWSLKLKGHSFDDAVMVDLPRFASLEILELHRTHVEGIGFARLDREPKLRVLRFGLVEGRPFNLNSLPLLPLVENVTVKNLGTEAWGFDRLAQQVPRLDWLMLQGAGRLVTGGPFPQALTYLTLTAKALSSDTSLPRRIDSLGLHLSDASPADVERILASVEYVERASLRGTPVDVALVRRLLARFHLKHIDLVDTKVDKESVRAIAREHPGLRLLPNLVGAKLG